MTSPACTRGGCVMKYFFQALQRVPSHSCPLSFPFTRLALGSRRAGSVWWAGSPRVTEVLNLRVFAPLKLHSIRAEIWSAKNCHFPPSRCIPEGTSGRRPKPIEGRDPVAEQCRGGSRNSLCWECLCWECLWLPGNRGAAGPWGEKQQHHFLCPQHPLPCRIFYLSVIQSQITGSQLSGSWGEGINTPGFVLGNGRKKQPEGAEGRKMCPPHLDRRHLEHRSALLLHNSSLPLENMTQW